MELNSRVRYPAPESAGDVSASAEDAAPDLLRVRYPVPPEPSGKQRLRAWLAGQNLVTTPACAAAEGVEYGATYARRVGLLLRAEGFAPYAWRDGAVRVKGWKRVGWEPPGARPKARGPRKREVAQPEPAQPEPAGVWARVWAWVRGIWN